MGGSGASGTQRHSFGQIAQWATLKTSGSLRPDITPPAKPAFNVPKAENQKPPLGNKLGAARVCDPLGKFSDRERGGVLLCVVVYDNVLALGRARWCLKAKLRHRSGYGDSAGGLILLKNAPMLSHEAFFSAVVKYERVLHF